MSDNLPAVAAPAPAPAPVKKGKHRTAAEVERDFAAIRAERLGRPSIPFDPVVAAEVIDIVKQGRGMLAVSRLPGMPGHEVLWRWMDEDEGFANAYRRARAAQADSLADEVEIMAEAEPRTYTDDKGVVRVDPGWVAWQRARAESKRWLASKLLPKIYGDRIAVDGDGAVGIAIQVNLTTPEGGK